MTTSTTGIVRIIKGRLLNRVGRLPGEGFLLLRNKIFHPTLVSVSKRSAKGSTGFFFACVMCLANKCFCQIRMLKGYLCRSLNSGKTLYAARRTYAYAGFRTIIVIAGLFLSFCDRPDVNRNLNWGFFGHQKINMLAVFLLPPEMLLLYKPNITYISEHAVDPDKRRYLIDAEGPRHYIDIDTYGRYPYAELPRNYDSALAKYSVDSVQSHGIVPWWTVIMLQRLTRAFQEKDPARIMKLSAELGHYIADAHVPLHASHNHNGQYTNQKGIHGFWESRIPELLADKQFDFFLQRAAFISDPATFIWSAVLASAAAADTVLRVEKELDAGFPADQKYAFETRNGKVVRQYSTAYTIAYDIRLKGMVERRMRQSIHATACFWYTAWVNAGQPALDTPEMKVVSNRDSVVLKDLELQWKNAKPFEKSLEP